MRSADIVSVSVLGASGYTGAETLRWLLGHPRVRVVGATANKHAGKRLDTLWPQFTGATDLVLGTEAPPSDVTFLCLPHGEASKLAPGLTGTVIDLSGDHRLPEPAHSAAYGFPRATHPWIYGLPELGHERMLGATRVANPGCFATALALALLPMKGALPSVVSAFGLTGSTGSGATPTPTTHHPARAENLRPYKVLEHQHVPEVVAACGGDFALDFVPMSAPLRRGILVTVPLPGASFEAYRTFYADNPLVRVLSAPPDLHGVLGSPRADVGVVAGPDGRAVVFCAIDNLCRGAGSQAVANLNLVMGWPVDLGLRSLPPVP
jgi:N-acetyl-gamma-glutamyl-phosphate/LysW-gamma-L-alpha-aminoadipyl-6-phosphate reductase